MILSKIESSKGLLIGSTTINSDAVPIIWELLISLNPIIHNRKIAGVFGSYGWSGEGVTNVDERFKQLKYPKVDPYKWRFKPNSEDTVGVTAFADEFTDKMNK
jgi:flavorubredoxin